MREAGSTNDPNANDLVARFAAVCAEDDRIVAAMLVGSRARNEADAHSDVDLCLITTDEGLEGVLADREAIVRRLGTPLFLESFGDPRNLYFILADGSDCELLCERRSDIGGIDVGPFATLVDKDGVLADAEFPYPTPDAEAQRERVGQIVSWFWHDLSHLIAALGRGDLWWAAGQLEILRASCVNLLRVEAGVAAADGEDIAWKLARDVPPTAELDRLARTFVPLERESMVAAARDVVGLFGEIAPRVAEAHDVVYPDELARLMTARLDALDT